MPNFGDVVSNVPFGVIGVWGLILLLGSNPNRLTCCFLDRRERSPYVLVFVGLLLTAFGSSYYHWSPNNARLVWDRLPMTIAFMAMVAVIIVERISVRVGLFLLPVLLLLSMGSVLRWYLSEVRGVHPQAPGCRCARVLDLADAAEAAASFGFSFSLCPLSVPLNESDRRSSPLASFSCSARNRSCVPGKARRAMSALRSPPVCKLGSNEPSAIGVGHRLGL